MSVKHLIDHLLIPAGVRRSASAGVDPTIFYWIFRSKRPS